MNVNSFKHIIDDILKNVGLYSPEAAQLLLATALHESGGLRHDSQINGPALSYFQIEPSTAQGAYDNWLDYRDDPDDPNDLKDKIDYFRGGRSIEDALLESIPYSVCMARVKYLRSPGALPTDIEGMAKYWKKYYNTELGKGTVKKFLDDWERYKPEGM